jgi:probable phosphoglycerate mutase
MQIFPPGPSSTDGYLTRPMTTIYLARHGQTDWNAQRRWQGHADPPLNQAGRRESLALGASLAGRGISRVYCSDLERARETAEIVGRALWVELELDERLREVDVGEWSGLTLAEVEELYPEGFARRRAGGTGWTTGEPFELMAARVVEALADIATRHAGAAVLAVSHGGPLRAVSEACLGGVDGWLSAGNCDYDVLVVDRGQMGRLDSSRGGLHQQARASSDDAV